MKTKPLNNNVLIEVIREDDGVSRSNESESLKKGRVIRTALSLNHLTASAGFALNKIQDYEEWLKELVGKIVRWEEHADEGQTFEENGKTYALIPWWRLISFEEEENE